MKTIDCEVIRISHCEPGRKPCTMVFASREDAVRHLRELIAKRGIDISEFYFELGDKNDVYEAELAHVHLRFGDESARQRARDDLQALRHRIAERHADDLSALIPIALGGFPHYRHWKLEEIEQRAPAA
jgi:hypothetical protein